jgi:hypothetical protein
VGREGDRSAHDSTRRELGLREHAQRTSGSARRSQRPSPHGSREEISSLCGIDRADLRPRPPRHSGRAHGGGSSTGHWVEPQHRPLGLGDLERHRDPSGGRSRASSPVGVMVTVGDTRQPAHADTECVRCDRSHGSAQCKNGRGAAGSVMSLGRNMISLGDRTGERVGVGDTSEHFDCRPHQEVVLPAVDDEAGSRTAATARDPMAAVNA